MKGPPTLQVEGTQTTTRQEHFPLSFKELHKLTAHPYCNTVHLQYQKHWT
jgi:hypothetical protein